MRSMEETIMFAIMSIVALVGFFLGALVTGYYTTKRADIELKAAWEYAALLEGSVEKLAGALTEDAHRIQGELDAARRVSEESYEKLNGDISSAREEAATLAEEAAVLQETLENAVKGAHQMDYVTEEGDGYIN